MQTESEEVALTALVNDIADELRSRHPSARIDVEPLPAVEINPVRARQLFTNLLENAVAHGGRADLHVTVRPLDTAGATTVSVADDGVGIPAAYREKVFGIFERLDGQGHPDGTGIGLAICKKIVEQAGGDLSIAESSVGADFRIRLPSPSPAPAAATARPALEMS
jgi:signal transduction histidine kinase